MLAAAFRRPIALALATALALGTAAAGAMAQGTPPPGGTPAAQPAAPATKPNAKPDEKSQPAQSPSAQTPSEKPVSSQPKLFYVKMSTSKGDIFLELNNEKAPISTQNFLSYVDKKYYDGTTFHRVMKDFMIQGGAFTPGNLNAEKPGLDKPIKNEWQNGLKNTRGAVAMARTGDPDSARAQFFINVVDNPFLDTPRNNPAAYAVFGRVVAGMEAVDAIRQVKTATKGPHGDVPVEDVVINSVVRIEEKDVPKK